MNSSKSGYGSLAVFWLVATILLTTSINAAEVNFGKYAAAAASGYSRYDFIYYYDDGSGDYYTGYVYAPTAFQTSGPNLSLGAKINEEPQPLWASGNQDLSGYYEITGITDGFDSSYDKQSYITAYYDADTAEVSLGVNSDGSSAAGAIYVADRTAAHESGYAFQDSVATVFDPATEIDIFTGFASLFVGVDYGPFHETDQNQGSTISTTQLQSDLAVMAQKFGYVRTYTVRNGLDQLPLVAQTHYPNLKLVLGVEIYSDTSDHATSSQSLADLQTAINLANTHSNVVGIIVGNECLSGDPQHASNYVTDAALVAALKTAYEGLSASRRKNVVVTTDLSFGAANGDHGSYLRQHAADYIGAWMINIYPWYAGPDGTAPTQAAIEANLNWNYNNFNNLYGKTGKTITIGETGWPSAGTSYGQSVASVPNEQLYVTTASDWMVNRSWSGFLFEMFDEAWKVDEGDIGPHWGLYYGNGAAKFAYTNPTHSGVPD